MRSRAVRLLDAFEVVATAGRGDFTAVREVSGIHSGNLGDIIYSLPTARMLGINHLYLNLCADPAFGQRVLTERTARMLLPLLIEQGWLERLTIVRGNVPLECVGAEEIGVAYNLDSFRQNHACPNLHLVYFHAVPFNLMVDATRPWLTIPTSDPVQSEPYMVVTLTPRYRRFDRGYWERLLADVPPERIWFAGNEVDQVERMNIPGRAFFAPDLLALARLVANARLFMGNPSGVYAIAEALKVPRLVELPEAHNVYPLDPGGRTLHQYHPDFVRTEIHRMLELENQAAVVIRRLNHDLHELTARYEKLREIALPISKRVLRRVRFQCRRVSKGLWRRGRRWLGAAA